MQVIEGVQNLAVPFASSVLTIGNFDGVHLGHRALIARVAERAAATSARGPAKTVVMTFEPHPMRVLQPSRRLKRIFDPEDQRATLESLGVDALVIEPFSREFSQLPPERYLLEWIYRPFSPSAVVVGYDFNFGADRLGTIDFLRSRGRELGFDVEVVPPVKIGDVVVSSSRIRQALEAGEVKFAAALLGRPFYLNGLIEKGHGRGRTIGVPTANVRTRAEIIPGRGVYCGYADVKGQRIQALVNIGVNPTFAVGGSVQSLSVEAHLLDFSGDVYGEEMHLEFIDRLRDEQKFNSSADLVAQIKTDIVRGRQILSGL